MSKSKVLGFISVLLIALIWCMVYYPHNSTYLKEYIFLSMCLIIFLSVTFFCFLKFGIYIFEPIAVVFVLYLFLFFIDPMINILNNETDVFGFLVMRGCIKATSVFMASYFCFLLAYYGIYSKKGEKYVLCVALEKNSEKSNFGDCPKVEYISMIIWLVSFGFGCIELVSQGMSVSYFLTLGLSGGIEDITATSAFGFFGNFRFSMITAWVYMFACNSKSWKTKICGMLTLEYFILRGFRHSLFVVIFAPIVYSFVKDKKSPKKKTVGLMLVVVVLVMGLMQFARGALRSGTTINWSTFNSDIFVESIQGNCDVYKTFYGMVSAVPSTLGYQWGMCSIVSVITMIIPRAIWPAKPISPIITNLGMFCGELAAKAGYAMPNISEYYLDFGPIGCSICLFIFGKVLQKLKFIIIFKRNDKHLLILYSVMFPALLQVVLRGYSPAYMYLLLFYAFPVILMKFIGVKE